MIRMHNIYPCPWVNIDLEVLDDLLVVLAALDPDLALVLGRSRVHRSNDGRD